MAVADSNSLRNFSALTPWLASVVSGGHSVKIHILTDVSFSMYTFARRSMDYSMS